MWQPAKPFGLAAAWEDEKDAVAVMAPWREPRHAIEPDVPAGSPQRPCS
jgi:hypothetical protein